MAEQQDYGNWGSYATWAVHLWITSDNYTMSSRARALVARSTTRAAPALLAAWVEDQCAKDWGLRRDLLTHARERGVPYYDLLRAVDWPHIVKSLL